MAITAGKLFLDTETRAERNIKAIGGYKHAATCECIIFTWAFEEEPVNLWQPLREPVPDRLRQLLADPAVTCVAHKAMYDRQVLKHALQFDVPMERWLCSMVLALSMGMPADLDMLGSALGLPADQRKNKEGKRLIQKFSKPRRPSKTNPAKYWDWDSKPEEWERFCDYGKQDVEAMRACWRILPDWNYSGSEVDLYHLDQRMNDRGVPIDKETIDALQATIDRVLQPLCDRLADLTDNKVTAPTQRNAIVEYINERWDVGLDSIDKASVAAELARGTLPDEALEILEIRRQASRSSTAKLQKMLDLAVWSDEFQSLVVPGGFQFDGASRTRRWAGRDVQWQNLVRGRFKGAAAIRAAEDAILGLMDVLYDDPLGAVSSCLRPVIKAPSGYRLCVSDLANIEGRGVAWLAGETWKLQAFTEYDAGRGEDIYRLTFSAVFGVPLAEVTGWGRQIGKVIELACAYNGAEDAMASAAVLYGFDLEDAFDAVWQRATRTQRQRAMDSMARSKKRAAELCEPWNWTEKAYLAASVCVILWRAKHPATCALWKAMETAAKAALMEPGAVFNAGPHIRFKKARDWLLMVLPNDRVIPYYKPSIRNGRLYFWGMLQTDTGARIWAQQATYGGRLTENGTQTLAREVLADSMPHVEAAGFLLVGTIHDEDVTLVPLDRDDLTSDRLNNLLATPAPWARGFPLAAAGYSDDRYYKD